MHVLPRCVLKCLWEAKLLVWGKNIKGGEQSLKLLEPGGSGSSRHEAASPAGDLSLLLTIVPFPDN